MSRRFFRDFERAFITVLQNSRFLYRTENIKSFCHLPTQFYTEPKVFYAIRSDIKSTHPPPEKSIEPKKQTFKRTTNYFFESLCLHG